MDDSAVVAIQIDREPRSAIDVVARCHLGLPVVIAVPPHLDDGTPFPTRYWLTCPLASRRIARLESAGGVSEWDRRVADDPAIAASFAAVQTRYAADRDGLVDGTAEHSPAGGVGGSRGGVKCLHAHYADHAAGNDNFIGADTARRIEPLNCSSPCVVATTEGIVEGNPDWREPDREGGSR
ncbi:MAG: DUF501 domain-containing protein [Acidimicrobiia bacterium]|nr:DUF501 domain-containing protein [Acidimicrobiia bacterium]NNC75734.1 DUF501 domain-containing protein [Acidimicrobiia bacterium]